MHEGESAWACFRNGPGGDLLPHALTLRDESLASINLLRLPAEVILPGTIPWNLVPYAEAQPRGEEIGHPLSLGPCRILLAPTGIRPSRSPPPPAAPPHAPLPVD